MDKNGIAGVVTIIVLFVIAVLLCNPIVVVGVGERGVKVTLGKVSPESLKIYNTNPRLYKRYSTSTYLIRCEL